MKSVLLLVVAAAVCAVIQAKSAVQLPAHHGKPAVKQIKDEPSIDEEQLDEEARIMHEIRRTHHNPTSIELAKRGWWGNSHESKSRHRSRSRYHDKRDYQDGASLEAEKRWRSYSRDMTVEWPSREDYWSQKSYETAFQRAVRRDKELYQRRYGNLDNYRPPRKDRYNRQQVDEPEPSAKEEATLEKVDFDPAQGPNKVDKSTELEKRWGYSRSSRRRSRSSEWPSREDFWSAKDFDRAWERALARDKEAYRRYYGSLKDYRTPRKPRWY